MQSLLVRTVVDVVVFFSVHAGTEVRFIAATVGFLAVARGGKRPAIMECARHSRQQMRENRNVCVCVMQNNDCV